MSDAGDGSYRATLTAPNVVGTAVFTATINGSDVRSGTGGKTEVNVSYAPVTARYVVTASNGAPIAGSTVVISAQLTDAQGAPLPTSGRVVTWSKVGSGGAFAAPTSVTDATGRATVAFTTDGLAGTTYTFSAMDGVGLQGTGGSVTTFTGAPSPARSMAGVAGTGSVGAPVVITIELNDASGNPIGGTGNLVSALAASSSTASANAAASVTVEITGANAGAPVSAVTSVGNGRYTASYTPLGAGVDTITVRVNGTPLSSGPLTRTNTSTASQLVLSISQSKTNPTLGDTLTVVMTVTNVGAGPALQAQVAVAIPMARFDRLSLVVSQGAFVEATQVWAIGTIAPQASATLTFRGVVKLPTTP